MFYKNKIYFISKLISSKTSDFNKEIDDCPTGRIYTRLFRRDSIGKIRFNTNIKISEEKCSSCGHSECSFYKGESKE